MRISQGLIPDSACVACSACRRRAHPGQTRVAARVGDKPLFADRLESGAGATVGIVFRDGPLLTPEPEVVCADDRQLLQAQPSSPQVFVLYFTLGKIGVLHLDLQDPSAQPGARRWQPENRRAEAMIL